MYKKIILLCILLYIPVQYASHAKPWLEGKASAFFFSDYPLNRIYHKAFEVQGSLSIPLRSHIDLYGSLGYRQAHGHALSSYDTTKLTVIPCDVGLKATLDFYNRGYYFFGMGPRFFYFKQHNDSPYIDRIIKDKNIGFFVNTGFNTLFGNHLLIGVFGEYSYEKKKVRTTIPEVYSNGNVQLGGFAVGVSIGRAF